MAWKCYLNKSGFGQWQASNLKKRLIGSFHFVAGAVEKFTCLVSSRWKSLPCCAYVALLCCLFAKWETELRLALTQGPLTTTSRTNQALIEAVTSYVWQKKVKVFLDAVKMQNQVVAKRKKINKTLARVADNPNRCKIWQRDASLQNCVSTFWGQQGLWFPERKKLLNFPIVPWLCGPLKVNICKGLSAAAMSSVVLHVDITYASYFQKEPSVYWSGSFITLKILYYGSKCNYKVVLSLAVVEVAGKQVPR